MHTRTNTALSRALKPMMLKTCASDFQLRLPLIAVRCLELLSSASAGYSSDQSLLVNPAFWEGQEQCSSCLASEGSPPALARQAVPLPGGSCLARHSGFPGSQECQIMPTWSPQEACLSLSRRSCHRCATLQVLESALMDQSCSIASAQLQLLPF